MDHARTYEGQIDLLLTAIERQLADRVVGIALRWVVVVHVGVGDHRLVDLVQVDGELGVVLRVGVGSQRRLFAGLDLADSLVGLVDQALQHGLLVVHSLVDHDLDAITGDLE